MLKYDRRKLIREGDRSSEFKLMLFELSIGGHYPGYIKHLIRYWCEHKFSGSLDIVVQPGFLTRNPDVVALASDYAVDNVNFIAIAPEEAAKLSSLTSSLSRARRAFDEWHLIYKYAEKLEPDHCLIMYFDTRQYPLALNARLPCSFSSIYFRPTFHYDRFIDRQTSWGERLQQWREKLLLSRILQHRQLHTLFCLDPFVVKDLERLNCQVKSVFLPDPVYTYDSYHPEPEALGSRLGIDPKRRVFLLFGGLNERKGICQLLEATTLLSQDLGRQLTILLIGPMPVTPENRLKIDNYITQITHSQQIQIIAEERFIPDCEIQSYFQLADVVLAPYQRHVGMSAILVRAAAAQKPVLASDYGLMGEITRRHQLGLTVDSTLPQEIARGLTKFLLNSPAEFGDRYQMQRFAEQNTAEKFAATIFQNLPVNSYRRINNESPSR